MTKTLSLALIGSLALLGCRSKPRPAPRPSPVSSQATECICGTPEAALHACLHPACVNDVTNPANPDCACGSLSLGEN